MKLRAYQQEILNKLINSTTDDIVQLDTGAGKTHIISALANTYANFIIVAHRNLLIRQLSKNLAIFKIKHNTISTKYTQRSCITEHNKFGKSFIDTTIQNKFCGSVDSLIARHKRNMLTLDPNLNYLIIIDEAHHIVADNKWGKLKEIFPDSRLIGFTATPCRLDNKSLHKSKGGLFDNLIQAEELKNNSVNKLIKKGFLSDFKVYSVASDIKNSELKIGKNNDYTVDSLIRSIDKSTVIGDVVKTYKKLIYGKRAIVMCVSIKNAEATADSFKQNNITAAAISSLMSPIEVNRRLEAFYRAEIKVLCNVDMLGEGYDVAAIDALIMIRKTNSFVSYRQWIGRVLRPERDKSHAIIIDHVGNAITHGLPDDDIKWDLISPRPEALKTNLIACANCYYTFHAWLLCCPECGTKNDLRRAKGLGNYYVDIKFIDFDLCEVKRSEIEREILLETEIIYPRIQFGAGAISELCDKLRTTFIEVMKNKLSIKEINNFLHSSKTNTYDFWVDNFTVKDLKTPDKFKKVYRKWLKSQ